MDINENIAICKHDGVTFYLKKYQKNNFKIIDMDVEPKITTINMSNIHDDSTVYKVVSVNMKNTTKQFANITTLIIGEKIEKIQIPNSLLPNVNHVYSQSPYFEDNVNVLIHNQPSVWDNCQCLINSFFQKEDTVIDLDGVQIIKNKALAGCKTANIQHTGMLNRLEPHALQGYEAAVDKQTGATIIGSMLLSVRQDIEEIEIPDDRYEITSFYYNIFLPTNIKKIKFHKYKTLDILRWHGISSLKVLVLDNIDNELSNDALLFPCTIHEMELEKIELDKIEVNEDNAFYRSVDGILYSKDGKILYKCPQSKTGNIIIPDDVENIAEFAFSGSAIDSIVLPKNLHKIEPHAFQDCEHLKEITFNDKLTYLPERCFSGCSNLHNIEIPGNIKAIHAYCFQSCSLKSVTFHEGLTEIHANAFMNNELESVYLPESLQFIGANNFTQSRYIYIHANMPEGLLRASICKAEVPQSPLIEIHMSEGTLYVPRLDTDMSSMHIYELLASIEKLPYSKINKVITSLYTKIADNKKRQEAAFLLYKNTKDEDIRQYLSKIAIDYCARLILGKNENMLVEFIEMNILTQDNLKHILQMTQKHQMPIATAYILQNVKQYTNNPDFKI